jgi:hypothetical protein
VSVNAGGRPIIFLVARREVLIRLAMIALVGIGIGAATLMIGKTIPVRVGFASATRCGAACAVDAPSQMRNG